MPKNNILVAALLLFCGGMQAQEQLSLQQAIDKAMQSNFQIEIARNDAEVAVNNNQPGNAGMLPNVAINVSDNPSLLNLNQRFTNGSEIVKNNVASNNFSANLALSYTLFDGGKMFATKAKLEELQAMGETNLKANIQNVVSNVIRAYASIISQQSALRVLQQLEASSRARYEIVKAKSDVGLANNTDIYLAELDLNTRSQAILSQQTAISNAFADLNVLLNAPVSTVYIVDENIAANNGLDRANLDGMFKNNPEYILSEQKINVAVQTEREAKAALYPRLGLTAAYGYSKAQSQAGFSLYNQTYGPTGTLTLSIPLFSGNVNARNHDNAVIQLESAQLQQKQTLASLQGSYEKAWQLYSAIKMQVETDKSNVETAQNYLDLMRQRFELGQSTILDFREAERTFEETNNRLIGNTYLLKLAETDLLRLTGGLLK